MKGLRKILTKCEHFALRFATGEVIYMYITEPINRMHVTFAHEARIC